jgi:hypothetical protein
VDSLREELWGRDRSRDRNIAVDLHQESYLILYFFHILSLHVIYSFSLVHLHQESFLILYFFSHPSTFTLGHGIARAAEGRTKKIVQLSNFSF